MSEKLENALQRLEHILPLKEKQRSCSKPIRALHQHVLRSFFTRGHILTREEMSQYVSNLEDAIKVLRDNDMVVFSEQGDPVGAYPFTMEVREHKVRVNGHLLYAMCALDALAVSPMFGTESQITSRCRITGDPVSIQQSGKTIVNLDDVGNTHFGIAWAATEKDTCCANSLCTEMIFLRDKHIARQWLADATENREVFTLQEAVELAGRFFVPIMERTLCNLEENDV